MYIHTSCLCISHYRFVTLQKYRGIRDNVPSKYILALLPSVAPTAESASRCACAPTHAQYHKIYAPNTRYCNRLYFVKDLENLRSIRFTVSLGSTAGRYSSAVRRGVKCATYSDSYLGHIAICICNVLIT